MHLSTLTTRTLLCAALALPSASYAIDLHGKELQLYGTLHPSIDYLDSDVSKAQADANPDDKLSAGDVSISYNSSNIGLRGELATDVSGLSMVYQLEQNILLDGSSSDTLNTRNSFAGLQGENWTVIAGRHDTLFKDLALRHSLIKHSVADRGAILGASALSGNQLDKRAENMLLARQYLPLGSGRLELQLQYSPDAIKSSGHVDNNKRDLAAAGVEWKSGARIFALAYDHWSNLVVNGNTGEINAWRGVWKETGSQLTTSLIVESIGHTLSDGSKGEMDRDAFALQGAWKEGNWRYLAQVMMAGSYADSKDTGATMWSAGVERNLSKTALVYGMYTRTDNEKNAKFQGVDGTHGDELGTVAGGSPQALSVGMVFKF